MIKKISRLVLALLLLSSCVKEVEKDLEIRLIPPKDWIEMTSEKELFKQIYKDSAELKLNQSRRINKNFKILDSYLKYDNSAHSGLNPTIQIQIHDNPDRYFKDFQETVWYKINWIKKNLDGYVLLEEPEKIIIDGVDTVHFKMTHEQLIDGVKEVVRNDVYMIPNGDELFQLTLNDNEEDDCSKEFIEVVKSIRLR